MDKSMFWCVVVPISLVVGIVAYVIYQENTNEGRLESLARRSVGNKLVKEYKGQELVPTVSGSNATMTVVPTDKWDEYVIMTDGSVYR